MPTPRREPLGRLSRAEQVALEQIAKSSSERAEHTLQTAAAVFLDRPDQLGALGLVLNAVVLVNTFYMDLTVKQLRRDGHQVNDEDVARLSPLGFKHIHFLGRYAFTLSEPGQVRPLRSPASADDDEDEE